MIADEEFAIDIHDIVGVERLENVLHLPKMPEFVEGVMRIRDEVVPLVKLRTRFGFAEKPNDEATRVMVIEVGRQIVGFIVDSVTAVYRLDRATLEAAPEMALTVESRFVNGVLRSGERMLILLNPFAILGDDEATQLGRAEVVARHYVAAEEA
jgi:purine-binding chemotaxis protein CheW